MTALIRKDALNLRALFTRVTGIEHRLKRGVPLLPQVTFEGDATETEFPCPRGSRPYAVFSDGSLAREGDAEAYTVTFDGFIHTVVFAVAPGSGIEVTIWPQET